MAEAVSVFLRRSAVAASMISAIAEADKLYWHASLKLERLSFSATIPVIVLTAFPRK